MTARSADSPQRPPHAGSPPPRLRENAAFAAFMATGWADTTAEPELPPGAAAAAAAHRDRLSAVRPGRSMVVAAGTAPVRNDDNHHRARVDSEFAWLTGCTVEGAFLVLEARPGGHDARLYLPAPLRPGARGHFADAHRGELWVGSSPGLAQWSDALGVEVLDIDELGACPGLLGASAGRSVDPLRMAEFGLLRDREFDATLARLRMIKDEWEQVQLRAAVDATIVGFAEVVAALPRATGHPRGERLLQGVFDSHARLVGNGPGYQTCVAAGPHAPTLHWDRCDGPVPADGLLLMDMGVEVDSLYTADLTRTVPVRGTFDTAQRAVYDLVEQAHRTALTHVRPGAAFLDFFWAAMQVLATGLHDWGVLPVSVDEALDPAGQHHRRWLPCGIGHHLGLDVHDSSGAPHADNLGADLVPGMVLTVEPGLYFHAHDHTVPPELRGIGVRIEDDVLVTPTGTDVLSAALPVGAQQVQDWTRALLARR